MNWVLVSLVVLGFGILFSQIWIAMLGIVLLILSIIRIKPTPSPSEGKGVLRHKLIQAPMDAWDTDEEDFLTAMAAMQGPPTLGVDVLYTITKETGEKLKPLEAGILRKMLPFSNYGASSAIQRMMAGLLLPIDHWIFPKTFEAHFRGKFGKEFVKKTFVFGQEKEAEKLLKEEEDEEDEKEYERQKKEAEEKAKKKKGKDKK